MTALGLLGAWLLLLAPASLWAQSAVAPEGDATFVVRLRGTQVGTASASLKRLPDGWSIAGTTRLEPPLDVTVRRIDVAYSDNWRPRAVTLDLAAGAETVVVHGGGFGRTAPARIDVVRGGRQVTFVTAEISADALILPNFAYAAYEALAMRLAGASPGLVLKAYVLPQREIAIRLDAVTDEPLRAGGRTVATRRWRLTFLDPSGETTAEVWVDTGRLARLDLPAAGLSVVRTDLSIP